MLLLTFEFAQLELSSTLTLQTAPFALGFSCWSFSHTVELTCGSLTYDIGLDYDISARIIKR